MSNLLIVTARGFSIVLLVSANTVFLSRGAASEAFVCSFCLGLVWWGNARTAARARVDTAAAAVAYAFGSAVGTVSGLAVAGWF